ncbi:hypothetical protein P389DRAFT_169778 [Cystobasidium minutum MCA 4210]|uniref:uncharacterized protein n=1 Tax=Cystobasidium minutum MCA 4210 TaxID=1397322 RepID=UPI0034CF1244|eukprot:jgi/Rhomi1/169778/fgenesh1_kg.3_\
MYIPFQQVFTAGLIGVGVMKNKKGEVISEGKVLDYCPKKCVDEDLNQHCTRPILVHKSTCYTIEWSTEGALSHTTAEFRDAKSNEIVYYRDTNGDWTPEKTELVYIDYMPKTPNLCNSTIDYTLKTCK